MGLDSPFKGPHKPIHGRLAAAVRAADALFMGSPAPWFAIVWCRVNKFRLSKRNFYALVFQFSVAEEKLFRLERCGIRIDRNSGLKIAKIKNKF